MHSENRVSKISLFMNGAGEGNIIFGDGLEKKKPYMEGRCAMELKKIEGGFSVCRLADVSAIDLEREYCFAARTDEEISLVCRTVDAPESSLQREDGWRAFRIQGELDFSLIGILAGISSLLAEAGIGIFVVSTYRTDYVLVKEEAFEKALQVLAEAGYVVV